MNICIFFNLHYTLVVMLQECSCHTFYASFDDETKSKPTTVMVSDSKQNKGECGRSAMRNTALYLIANDISPPNNAT